MAANLESTISEKLKSLPPDKQQQVLDFVEELANGKPRETVAQKLERHLRGVPPEELAELSSDASENLDHYL
jgi:mRNA-degrading endonuclease RelE of RelBE toxin-antitoxin system